MEAGQSAKKKVLVNCYANAIGMGESSHSLDPSDLRGPKPNIDSYRDTMLLRLFRGTLDGRLIY